MVTKGSEYAIETFSLTKIFPDWWGRAKVVAVEDLDLRVNYNEIYGFLGPNGSGKTTTLKMLLNLLHPSQGKSLLLGGTSTDPKVTARIGYLPEDSYLYRYLTARETLDFYGRLFQLPGSVRKSRIDTLLEMVGLSGMANRQIGTFSKGMARRIGLAQALINDPELLILDEPTSGMDPIGTRQIKDLLIHLAKRGKTILLCSHLLADVEDVCDRIGILYGGRMQVEGPVRNLLQHSEQKQILTGALSESSLAKIRQIATEEQVDCEVTSPMARLEDYFINIVARAQEEKKKTSGAISTTSISGFLAEEEESKGILDELVSKPVSPEPSPDITLEKVEQERTAPAEDDSTEDVSLLEKLTAGSATTSDDSVEPAMSESEEVSVEPIQSAEDVRKDLLDALTKDINSADGSTEQVSEESGEPEDA